MTGRDGWTEQGGEVRASLAMLAPASLVATGSILRPLESIMNVFLLIENGQCGSGASRSSLAPCFTGGTSGLGRRVPGLLAPPHKQEEKDRWSETRPGRGRGGPLL